MTTEHEILEFAAKACGITVHGLADKFVAQHNYGSSGLCIANDRGGDSLWNPLINSGDCAAMCVKLKIATTWGITYDFVDCSVGLFASSNETRSWFRDHNNDREAAWRYAATMVAAKIGGMV